MAASTGWREAHGAVPVLARMDGRRAERARRDGVEAHFRTAGNRRDLQQHTSTVHQDPAQAAVLALAVPDRTADRGANGNRDSWRWMDLQVVGGDRTPVRSGLVVAPHTDSGRYGAACLGNVLPLRHLRRDANGLSKPKVHDLSSGRTGSLSQPPHLRLAPKAACFRVLAQPASHLGRPDILPRTTSRRSSHLDF